MNEELKIAVADQIAVLTLSRAMSLDSAGKHAIGVAVEELGNRDDVRALILTASDPAAFLVNVSELADREEGAAAAFSLIAADCGHFVQEEQPEFLTKTLLDFLPTK